MSNAAKQVQKATKTAKATRKGKNIRKFKIRTKLRFYKPKTLSTVSKPKYERSKKIMNLPEKFDKFSVLVEPVSTGKANKYLTERNTVTFFVHNRANKVQIKRAFKDIYGYKARKINTLVTTHGRKKAYIILRPEDDAVKVGSKFGAL